MEKIENEKIYRIILAIFTAFSISIITIFCFFCIGLSKVDAQVPDYSWNSPRLMGISTSDSILDESAVLASSTNSNSVTYNSNIWGGTNVYIRYRVIDSDQATQYFVKGTYSFSYKVSFRLIGTDSIANITPKLLFYPNSSNTYGTATCDTKPIMILTQTGTDPTTYDFTYSCNTFNVTTDVNWFAVGFSVSKPVNYVTMAQNLKFTGPSDTQDIINNQNQNTQDIINGIKDSTDKVVDAIQGEGLEDTTPVNPDKKNELEEVEEGLLNENITTSLNDIDISIDTNSNEFIWNLVTRIINTHSLIFGLVLTMLSLGILKLVLNR